MSERLDPRKSQPEDFPTRLIRGVLDTPYLNIVQLIGASPLGCNHYLGSVERAAEPL